LRAPVSTSWLSVEAGQRLAVFGPGEDTEIRARMERGMLDVVLRQTGFYASDPTWINDARRRANDGPADGSSCDDDGQCRQVKEEARAWSDANPGDPFSLALRAVAEFGLGSTEKALAAADRGLAAADQLPPSPRRDRAVRLLTRHRAEFRAGLP